MTLISTGFAAPHKKPTRTHSKKAVASKSHKSKKENNRRASSSKAYNRGRRYVESKPTPKHVSHSSSKHDIGRATITGININVRSAPNSNASVVTKVSGGDVAITAQKGDWYKLRFQHGSEGWVREDFLRIAGKPTKASAAKMIPIKLDPVVTSAKTSTGKDSGSATMTRYVNLMPREVNIRRGPSTSNSLAGTVKGGRALVVDKWDDWYKLKFKYGTTGWVRKDFLEFPSNFDFKNARNKPVIETKPTTVVATKTKPIERGSTPENTVENVATGERTTIEAETKNNSAPIMAKVVGDDVVVRKGASKTNSVLTKVDGGPVEILDQHGDFYQVRFQHGTVGWVHANYVSYPGHEVKEPEPLVTAEGDDKITAIMENANVFVKNKVRYVYGGANRSYTDCSGFTLQVFRAAGINLPRTAREQATRGQKVGRWDLKTGDLVFFNTRGYISHVGIYVGDQKFVHASSGGGRVMQSSLNESYYGNRFLFGRRIVAQSNVRKLPLPKIDEVPVEKDDQRGDDENKVDISKNQKNDDSNSPSH